jgi:serine/threonine-protein kinase
MSNPTTSLAEQLSGSYVLERPLGAGGMATVWLARDLKHQRHVALKVLKPELAHALGPERFRREITTAARLQHPHILSVHDSGETATGQLWFTMPYVAGESLRDRLKREGRLPVEDALRIAREAAQALQHAHGEGIVHRDIKPENLLLTKDGSTLVADFGIARGLAGTEGSDTPAGTQLTETGTSIGTPQYMAPEQATGQSTIDARADQYALAATLYEMLAGEPPFTGATGAALIAKRFSAPVPSVRTARPEVPAAVDQALQRALALSAEDRFASIQAFARALGGASPTASGAGAATVAVPAAPRGRRVPRGLGLGALAVLLALGGVLAGRRQRGAPATPAPPAPNAHTLAVLPFENLGDTADAYFAEGVSDELRGKLTGVPDLQVIARASSVSYRGTHTPLPQIAKELGVRYLLTGTVRWAKAGTGPASQGRVRVSPELIEVTAAGVPASKWQQPFDAPLTDVFQVQSDIAGQVARALDAALGQRTVAQLAQAPTTSVAAYDAYLRGEAATDGGARTDPASSRRAIAAYEQAVALDSAFTLAWSALARERAVLYDNSIPTPALAAAALAAVTRAEALAPGSAAATLARASYARQVQGDPAAAVAAVTPSLQRTPNDPVLLRAVGSAAFRTGDAQQAVRYLEPAARLDPRSAASQLLLAQAQLGVRRYDAAEAAARRLEALAPQSLTAYEFSALVALARGDPVAARRQVQAALTAVGDTAAVLAYFVTYEDLAWLLEPTLQRRAVTLGPEAFDGARGLWALGRAQLYALLGDTLAARTWGDTAQRAFFVQLQAAPANAQQHALLGLALAFAGRPAEAVAEGERGVAIARRSNDEGMANYLRKVLAWIDVLAGRPVPALDQLEALMQAQFWITPGWVRLDPAFTPLRGTPRFERLVAGP